MQKLCKKMFFPRPLYRQWHQHGPHPKVPKSDLGSACHGDFHINHLRHGPSRVGAPKVHSTGDKNEQGGCGHKQSTANSLEGSRSKEFIWIHIELPMGFRNCKWKLAKCRTKMMSQDHMWKLPWKSLFTQWLLTLSRLLGYHAQNFIPNWFSLGFPDFVFPANGLDALIGLAKMHKKHTDQTWELHWLNTPEVHCWKKALQLMKTEATFGYSVLFQVFVQQNLEHSSKKRRLCLK